MQSRVRPSRVPEKHARNNPMDTFLRNLTGRPVPTRNDCGYPGRFEHEDTSRMHGWAEEGTGMCDYPSGCAWFREGKCPLQRGDTGKRE